jgi:hypothetical protein
MIDKRQYLISWQCLNPERMGEARAALARSRSLRPRPEVGTPLLGPPPGIMMGTPMFMAPGGFWAGPFFFAG